MADISETTVLSRNVVYMKYLVVTGEVDTSDTITVDSLTSITNAYVAKQQDGTAVTFTKATNVLTITTAALTDEPVVAFVIGY